MHIALAIFFIDAVKNLGVAHRAKRCHSEHLCLAAGKHSGTVRALEHINLCCQRADLINAAPIHTLAVIQQPATYNEFLELIQQSSILSASSGNFSSNSACTLS